MTFQKWREERQPATASEVSDSQTFSAKWADEYLRILDEASVNFEPLSKQQAITMATDLRLDANVDLSRCTVAFSSPSSQGDHITVNFAQWYYAWTEAEDLSEGKDLRELRQRLLGGWGDEEGEDPSQEEAAPQGPTTRSVVQEKLGGSEGMDLD